MRLLALLVVALPTVAGAAPSAVNIDATLAHDRELLASHATALCACKNLRCGEKHVDAYLQWKLDQDLMKMHRAYDAYLAAVAKDPTIAGWREQLDDCNTALFMKPQARVCKKRVASAAKAFSREAPRAYAPYKTLAFRSGPHDARGAVASVQVLPGRSWSFSAAVGPRSMARDFGIELDQIADEWGTVPSEFGVIAARKMGPVIAIVEVRSERWGEFEPEDHPLTKLFLSKMMAAATKCVK
ncbi:MAG: hypothetical protein M4D80_36295 [Myxococcota bacterium]|nr:hypothetical protein [Deltaproteobacteria bacterium]MDQ3340651.1 hypothetical protein [Myxococcota bacterium]